MHSLLDRGTILTGLVDELRPLLPPLGGALGDLCAGFGQAEAAEQALESAFMIRAAAEMLELDDLTVAAGLVEEAVPLLNGAPPTLLRDGLPVVRSMLTALEQATDALTRGGERPAEALEAAQSGLERLRTARQQVEAERQLPSLDLEQMLATLPDSGPAADLNGHQAAPAFSFVKPAQEAEPLPAAVEEFWPFDSEPITLEEEAVEVVEPIALEDSPRSPVAETTSEPEAAIAADDSWETFELAVIDSAETRETATTDDWTTPGEAATAPAEALADHAQDEPSVIETRMEEAPGQSEHDAAPAPLVPNGWVERTPVVEADERDDGPPTAFRPSEKPSLFSRFLRGLRGKPGDQRTKPEDRHPATLRSVETQAAPAHPSAERIAAHLPAMLTEPVTPSVSVEPASGQAIVEIPAPVDETSKEAPEAMQTEAALDSVTEIAVSADHEFAAEAVETEHSAVAELDDQAEGRLELAEPASEPTEAYLEVTAAAEEPAGAQPETVEPVEVRFEISQPMEEPTEEHTKLPEPFETSALVEEWTSPGPAAEPLVKDESSPSVIVEPDTMAEMPLPEVLQETPQVDPEILEVFLEEAAETLGSMSDHLSALQADLTNSSAAAELRRASHTLKGTANVVGFPAVGLVGKAMEDLLDGWAGAGEGPDQATLRFLERSYQIIKLLVPNPAEPALIRQAADLASEGADLLGRISPAGEAASDDHGETGLGADEAPLSNLPAVAPQFLAVFLDEAEEVLSVLDENLATLAQDPADQGAAAELRRACHTLTGAANAISFESIGSLCRAMYNLLEALLEAGVQPEQPMLGCLNASATTIRQLMADQHDVSALDRVAELVGDAERLAIHVGVSPDTIQADESTPESAAWSRAVDEFLSDGTEDEQAAWSTGEAEPQPDESRQSAPSDAQTEAPAQAGQADDGQRELVAVFALEAEEHVAALSGVALRLDLDPRDTDAMGEARRVLHTLKGAAAALGLEIMSSFCHETEARLDQEDPADAARLLFEVAEALEQSVRTLAQTGSEGDVELPEWLPLPMAAFLTDDEPAAPPAAEASTVAAAAASMEPTAEIEEPAARSGSVRVDLGRIDELLNMVGEVVQTRSGLEQRLERVSRSAEELRLTVARLRRVAQYLEERYEVAELLRTDPNEVTHGEFDELEMDRYTELHRVSREVNELSADAETTSDELELALKELDTLAVRQARLGSDLQDRLMAVRLVPLSTLAPRLHRTARSAALKLGKQVEFVLQGAQTELDKRVVEELGNVMLHLIRNAVDHGIESPEERVRADKPAAGLLTVRAFREGSEAVIQISDDGAGIDLGRLRQRGEVRGLVAPDQDLDDQELLDLIFQPGISTSRVATDVSGRGVGLDVVRTTISELKGSVEVSSDREQGTTFTLRLPVVLAVLQAMLVKAGEQTYAIPVVALERVLRTHAQPTLMVGRTSMIELDGETFPYFDLGPALGLPAARRADEETPMLVVRTGERRVAMAVTDLLGQQEIVVKSLGPHLRAVRGVFGATIQGNGQVLLVLNTAELITSKALSQKAGRPDSPSRLADGALTALVVDDSLSVRKILARTLERGGWEVRQARDGVDALEVLQGFRPGVVLMDIEMPRMDGFELASILRDVPDYGRPPVVMITSRAGDKHRKRAEELGVKGYLVKPYQEAELLQTLREIASASVRG